MSHRGANGDEPVRAAAALQELSAGVVHGVYRLVKACQFHADVTNDAVTSLTASAAGAVAEYCSRGSCETVALSFLGDAIFVNRQILKASRDTHALAAELRDLLAVCEVTELTLAHNVDRDAMVYFAKLLADVQRDRSLMARLTAGGIPAITTGKARFAATGESREESPGQRAARTYATSVLTVKSVLADVRQGKFELPRRVKRVAQQVVARADEDARLLVALAATGGVSLDAATIAVGSAILAVAMTRQLTTDRALLANAAMAALLYDAGRAVMGGSAEGLQRTLNDDELDRVPARTVLALTALGRMHAPARARTALLYEVWSMRRAHRVGPVYKGRRPPTLLARIIGVARAFAELRGAGAGGGLSIDDALQMLGTRAADGTERALIKLLIGALGIYPAGTMVTLNTGELGVVMGTPAMPLDYVRPPVKILYDEHANLIEEPIDVDLAALAPGAQVRFIWKSVDADEQQMKAMRSYVVAATAAKRRGALAEPAGGGAESRPTAPVPAQHPTAPAPPQRATSPVEHLVAKRVELQPMVVETSLANTVRPPMMAEAAPMRAEMLREPTPRSANQIVTMQPPAKSRREAPRRRDPRLDSAPPASLQDEVLRPVHEPRPAPGPVPLAGAPVLEELQELEPVYDELGELEPVYDELGELEPVYGELEEVHEIDEEPPPVSREVLDELFDTKKGNDRETARPPVPDGPLPQEPVPASSRDELLAAFLADAPIASEPPPEPRATVKPKKP